MSNFIHDQSCYAELEEQWPPRRSLMREFREYLGGRFWSHLINVGAFLLILAAFVAPLLLQRIQLGIF